MTWIFFYISGSCSSQIIMGSIMLDHGNMQKKNLDIFTLVPTGRANSNVKAETFIFFGQIHQPTRIGRTVGGSIHHISDMPGFPHRHMKLTRGRISGRRLQPIQGSELPRPKYSAPLTLCCSNFQQICQNAFSCHL